MRQRISTKPWCPAFLLCRKTSDKRMFLKHQSVLQWNISVQWAKTSTEIRDNPPVLSIYCFSLTEVFWNTMAPWRSCFGPVRYKNFRLSRQASFSFAGNYSIPEFIRNTEGLSWEIYRHCETKIFQRKIVIPFCIKFEDQWWNWCL